MAAIPYKLWYNYKDIKIEYIFTQGPLVHPRKTTQKFGFTDATGATHLKSLRRRRAVVFEFPMINKEQLNKLENFIDNAEDYGVEYFQLLTDFCNTGDNKDANKLVEMQVYRADEKEYESLFGKDWVMRQYKYKIVFIEPIGKALNSIESIIE